MKLEDAIANVARVGARGGAEAVEGQLDAVLVGVNFDYASQLYEIISKVVMVLRRPEPRVSDMTSSLYTTLMILLSF